MLDLKLLYLFKYKEDIHVFGVSKFHTHGNSRHLIGARMEIFRDFLGDYVYTLALESNRKARLEIDFNLRNKHHILVGFEFDSLSFKTTFAYLFPENEVIDYSRY